jgi:hypothetical protein
MRFPIPPRCVVVDFHAGFAAFQIYVRGYSQFAMYVDEFMDAIDIAHITATIEECEVYITETAVNHVISGVTA